MRTKTWIWLGTLASMIGVSAPAVADTVHFDKGSLIIPMESYFQPKGGMISAYGLVYRILLANGTGHKNEGHKVTVYILNRPDKTAPNRCIPTNVTKLRSTSPSVPSRSDTRWQSDGCDFSISNGTAQPVVPVDYSIPFPTTGYAHNAIKSFDDSDAWPRYNTGADLSEGPKDTSGNPKFNTVSYLGAPFAISAADAPYVIALLRDGDTGADAPPKKAIDIFTNSQGSACNNNSLTQSTNTYSGVEISSGCHYVYMHQATASFDAPVSRRINRAPRPFALYEAQENGRGGSLGLQVLEKYIKIAGLWVSGTTNHADSMGCPVGNVTGCTLNGSHSVGTGNEASAADVNHGIIYDFLKTTDLDHISTTYPKGILNYYTNPATKKLFYALFWAPHWDAQDDGQGNDANGVSSVVDFVNGAGNVMMECASINTLENGSNSIGGPDAHSNFLFTKKIDGDRTYDGTNCSDPGADASDCVNYPNSGNVFSQVGDWIYQYQSGSNDGFEPSNGMQTWTNVMVSSTHDGEDRHAFDMGQQDDKHGAVVYVAGHDVSGEPVGSRIVLNSMLNLSGDPIPSERALAAPVVAYKSSNSGSPSFVDQLIAPTFDAVSGYDSNPAVRDYTPLNANLWVFPYYPGSLRAHPLDGSGALSTGENDLDASTLWNAGSMAPSGIAPEPGDRNLFTYLGGYPKDNPTLSVGGSAPNGVLQMNWKPQALDGHLILDTVQTLASVLGISLNKCVDVMGFNPLVTTPTFDDGETSALRMVVGGDGLCDVQEAANLANLNSGSDWGSVTAANAVKYLAAVPATANMLQRVRGYCSTNSLTDLAPALTDCVDGSDDRAHLGGLVHSTPAVVGPSPNIAEGHPRPSVAYVGGYDGQLHAFYVGGGKDYAGPASPLHFADDDDASPTFASDFATSFADGTTPDPGTELWSFVPASQLSQLAYNNARVDSSPVVEDVYADFSGSGLREWHTVLVVSVGGLGSELFAMDITNPLRPRLLWDIAGSLQAGHFSPTMLLNDSLVSASGTHDSCTSTGNKTNLPGKCVVPKWSEEKSYFKLYPATDNPGGRTMTKVYDYQDLGASRGLSLVDMNIGIAPTYMVFAATNIPSVYDASTNTRTYRNGIEVFGIDVATGQKRWQWEHEYGKLSHTPDDLDDDAPPVATVIAKDDGTARVLVGDFEGRIWELDAATGVNVNMSRVLSGCSITSPCKYPAFDAYAAAGSSESQPITTNIAVAVVPTTTDSGSIFHNYAGAKMLVFGTAGSDSISNPSTVSGRLHTLLYDAKYRVPVASGVGGVDTASGDAFTASSTQTKADATGVLQEPTGMPDVLAEGERVYGNITVTGQSVVYSTAKKSVPSDINTLAGDAQGSSYVLDLGSATSTNKHTVLSASVANYGGVAVYSSKATGTVSLLSSEVSKLNRINVSNGDKAHIKPNTDLSVDKDSFGSGFRNWLLRFLK